MKFTGMGDFRLVLAGFRWFSVVLGGVLLLCRDSDHPVSCCPGIF